MLTGTLKVSRENEDGHELVLYYVKAGEGCAMTFSCGMMSQPSQVKGTAEEDLSMLCVPVPVMEHGTSKPGKEGELATLAAYRAVDPK